MSVKNFYPQFPEIPYQRTSVEMPVVVAFARTLVGKYTKDTVRMALAIFRNESGNGKYGVNNNYGGIQADDDVWEGLDLSNVVGTCIKKDNEGDLRRFICFNENGYQTCFDFVCYKVQQRKMVTANDYWNKWVSNNKEKTKAAVQDFGYLLKSATLSIP